MIMIEPSLRPDLLLRHPNHQRALLIQLALELRNPQQLTDVMNRVLRALTTQLHLSMASILINGIGAQPAMMRYSSQGMVQSLSAEEIQALIDRGIQGQVLQRGQSIIISDVSRSSMQIHLGGTQGGSLLATPIRQNGTIMGVLAVRHSQPNAFTSQELLLLEGVAALTEVAVGVALRSLDEARRRDTDLTLMAISQFLATDHSSHNLATMVQQEGWRVFGAEYSLVFQVLNDQLALSATPDNTPVTDANMFTIALNAARQAWDKRDSQTIAYTESQPACSCLALPLVHNGERVGVLVLIRHGDAAFTLTTTTWLLLTIFANSVAAACATIHFVEQLRQHTDELEVLVQQRTRQVQRSRDLLRIVFDSLPEGMLLIDADGIVLVANSTFCKQIAGMQPREVVGQTYEILWLETRSSVSPRPSLADLNKQEQLLQCRSHNGEERSYLISRHSIPGIEHERPQFIEIWQAV